MIREALQYLNELAQPEWRQAENGYEYTSKSVNPVRAPEPRHIEVSTLTAFDHYVNENPDNHDKKSLIVCINSPTNVLLQSTIVKANQRFTWMQAKPVLPEFHLSDWTPLDQFVPRVQAGFLPTQNRDELIKTLSHVSHDTSLKTVDDGTSQQVEVQSGIRKAYQDLPNPITLQRYSTFPEVEQPAIMYVLRLERRGGDAISARLIEADGGAWRMTAIERIKDWIERHINVPILA